MSVGRLVTALAIGAGVLIVAIALAGSGGEDPGSAPGASSIDEGSGGLSRWASLLELRGHDVERRLDPPSSADLDPGETAVLLEGGELSDTQTGVLEGFVRRGGRLIIGGEGGSGTLRELAGSGLGPEAAAGEPLAPFLPVPETAEVESVAGAGRLWADTGPALPVLGAAGGGALLARGQVVGAGGTEREGAGALLLLSDATPLTNGAIGDLDNARFAANLAGPEQRRVVFIEDVGDEGATGAAALPARWGWAALLLLVAALTLIAARARRLGPPDRQRRELPPPRRDYVDALAGALARARPSHAATDRLRRAALARLSAMAGSDRPSADMLARAGRSAGLTAEELNALERPVASDGDAVLAGRALSKLWR